MAETVKEAVPDTRPSGQRRGLDRLRASGTAAGTQDQPVRERSQTPPVRAAVREEPSAASSTAPASPVSASLLVEDAPTAPTAATEPAETAAPAGRRSSSVRLLAAAIAVMVLLVGFLGSRLWHTRSAAQADRRQYEQVNATDARNQAVLSAARQAAVTLLTYDYRHLDRDFAAVLDGSTGGFKKDFASKSATAKTLFTQGKAVASGQVLDAAVASSTATSATVLAVLDQSVRNVSVPNGTVKHYRMQLRLDKVGSAWLVSDVEFPA